ncbi:MAG: hypothetical protein ACOC8Y_06085 [Candidatus Natronoplasma sp.]
MNKKDDKERGILIRILSNKDIQKGIVFFVAALILAFVAVTPATSTNVEEETISEEEYTPNVPINYPIYDVINATLELEIISDSGDAEIEIQNETHAVLESEILEGGGDLEIIDLEALAEEEGEVPSWLNFTNINGELRYAIIFTYIGSPYGLLSLPAALFTLIGIVFAFKGKGVILGEIRRKQMEEEARKQEEERKEDSESEKSADETKIEGEIIYEGDETPKKKDEADHINFMGIPSEDDDDEKEK